MAELPKTRPGEKPKKKKPQPHPEYTCICCGETKKESEFYKSKNTRIWIQTDGTVTICRSCLNKLFHEFSDRYGEQVGLSIVCHYLDIPFDIETYKSVAAKNSDFQIGYYIRVLNNPGFNKKSFATSIVNNEFAKTDKDVQDEVEAKWSRDDIKNKNAAIEIIGYDPFAQYPSVARKFLFGEITKYLDDDVAEDPYKLSIIIQLVTSTYQISQYDFEIAKLSPTKDAADIKILQDLKAKLVNSNNATAKENEISVKNRSNKDVGRTTLGYLMRDLREKDFVEAEANYYDQLRSTGTLWAMDMSMKAIEQNAMFDENDKQEMFIEQRKLIQDLQAQLDDKTEECRLLGIENESLKQGKR